MWCRCSGVGVVVCNASKWCLNSIVTCGRGLGYKVVPTRSCLRGGHPVLDPPHFRCTHFGISSFVTDPRQKGWGKPVPIRGSCGRADDSACGSFAGLQQRTSRRVLFERLVAQLHLEVGVCRCRQLSTTLKHFQRLLAACARRCQS